MPLFVVMGAPLLVGVPVTLWYAHRQAHLILRVATAVCSRAVTSVAPSYPVKTAKLRVIGQGIDTDFFAPSSANQPISDAKPTEFKGYSDNKLTVSARYLNGVANAIVHVARLMPIKHQATLIRALVDVPNAQAVFVGDVPPDVDPAYRRELETLARDLGVAERVTFAGNQAPEGVRDWNRKAAIAVNLSPIGLFDKAALESMAVGVPTMVGSTAFDDTVRDERLKVTDLDDAAGLAAKLNALLALPEDERCQMGLALRERVIALHSVEQLIRRLVNILNTGEPE
jgi:glycosyltransferase involved in cell wall biosynthesis